MFSENNDQLREFYRQLPLGVTVENYSDAKLEIDKLLAEGVKDIDQYLLDNPEVLFSIANTIETIDANEALLKLFKAESFQEYFDLDSDVDHWRDTTDWMAYYAKQFASFAAVEPHFGDYQDLAKDGSIVIFSCVSWIPSDVVDDWSVVLTTHEEISGRKELEEKLRTVARKDHLTGLLTRIEFDAGLDEALERIKRTQSKLALLFIDLNDFKIVNDDLGHDAGDEVLQLTALRIEESLRKSDTASRWGGDEFAIILEGSVSEKAANVVVSKLHTAFRSPLQLSNGQSVIISASIGVAFAPDDGGDAKSLFAVADEAMYKAKKIGKDAP